MSPAAGGEGGVGGGGGGGGGGSGERIDAAGDGGTRGVVNGLVPAEGEVSALLLSEMLNISFPPRVQGPSGGTHHQPQEASAPAEASGGQSGSDDGWDD